GRRAGGGGGAGVVVSSRVRSLAREALKSMLLTKIKLGTAAVLGVGLLLAAACGLLAPTVLAQESKSPPADQSAPAARKAPAESDEEFIKRLSKDLRGHEPTTTEVHFFVASNEPGKRDRQVGLLVKGREARKQADALSRLQEQNLNFLNNSATFVFPNGLSSTSTLNWTHGLNTSLLWSPGTVNTTNGLLYATFGSTLVPVDPLA